VRIAQLVNTLAVSDGGPARNSFELNITLNQLPGVSARLFWVHGTAQDSVLAAYRGAAGPLPVPGPQRFRRIRDFAAAVRGAEVLVIHGYYLPWVLPAALLAAALGTAVVVTPHGALTGHQQKTSVHKKRLFDRTLGQAIRAVLTGFVTGSETEARDLRAKFPKARVRVAGVGTTMPAIDIDERPWNSPLRLLALSRIAPKKRHDLILGALSVLRDRGITAELDIVGAGPRDLVADLQSLATTLGISEQVRFHNQKSGAEKEAFYRDADLYLLPSDDENFGISLAESLAHGLPAIASTGVASAMMMDNSAGRVLNAPTEESIADAIVDLCSGDRALLSQGARDCAETNFSWRAAAGSWISALDELGVAKDWG
jgi:glycosyltransferase involved in cell wall biosynthesis